MTNLIITALILSGVFIAGAILLCVLLARKDNKNRTAGHRFLSPLQVFTIIFFFAVAVALFPVNYFTAGGSDFGGVVKSVLLSFQNALQVFTVNAGFDGVQSLSQAQGISAVPVKVYSVYVSVLFIAAPAVTAGFILSMFKETSARLKYYFHIGADIHVLSELNEKSLTLAQDIREQHKHAAIVFADVDKSDDNEELIGEAKKLGAVCFRSDITEIGLKKRNRRIVRKLYFISEDEGENLRQALSVIGYCKDKRNLDSEKTSIYVFARSLESETLLDSVDCGKMRVRRVNDFKNLAWQTLQKVSIFADADNAGRNINVVIIGLGRYGLELLKAVCWLGQMPTYKVHVHVFDIEENLEGKMRGLAPDLIEHNGEEVEGEAQYSIKFYPKTDVNSEEFISKIKGIQRITSVFVTLGNDETNIDTALKIRIALAGCGQYPAAIPVNTKPEQNQPEKEQTSGAEPEKAQTSEGQPVKEESVKAKAVTSEPVKAESAKAEPVKAEPAIYPVVYSTLRAKMLEEGQNLKISGKINGKEGEISYGLTFIGSITECYSTRNIEREELEKYAREYHLVWTVKSSKIADAEKRREAEKKEAEDNAKFDKYEYFRNSSMAQAIFYNSLKKIDDLNGRIFGDKNFSKAMDAETVLMFKEYEHRRWNAYMRAEGYTYSKTRNDLARQHTDLKPFYELSPADMSKDEVWEVAKNVPLDFKE